MILPPTAIKSIRLFRATAAAIVLMGCLNTVPAYGGDWMFRRSYYSHEIPQEVQSHYPVPNHRSAYRAAIAPRSQGFTAQITQRFNRVYIQSGNSSDVTIFREYRFQLKP